MKTGNIVNRHPLLICITHTRNYAWITRAFLQGNIRWADYIVVVDQMSTDGTRELCAKYDGKCTMYGVKSKVVLVDDTDMAFKESTGYKMAFEKGRELAAGRDAIFFALDIDEVMPANWMETKDGQKILDSKPGDMFAIAWANIQPDNKTYVDNREIGDGKYTVFHDNGMAWQEHDFELHAPHLPYPTYEIAPYAVRDFSILHFGWYHPRFKRYKAAYHQCLDIHQKRSKSPIALMRVYLNPLEKGIFKKKEFKLSPKPIEREWLAFDFDLFDTIDMTTDPIFITTIKELLNQDGIQKYRCLNIWSEDLRQKLHIESDPCPWNWKIIHNYLQYTQPYRNTIVVRAIDKLLKLLYPTSRL